MEDEDQIRDALDELGMDDPHSFEEANVLYSVLTGIVGMK